MGGELNSLNKNDFLLLTHFLFSQIKRKSINNCYFLTFVISVWGSHCDYLPWVQKDLATPLPT
jgi:hypothetical protein